MGLGRASPLLSGRCFRQPGSAERARWCAESSFLRCPDRERLMHPRREDAQKEVRSIEWASQGAAAVSIRPQAPMTAELPTGSGGSP